MVEKDLVKRIVFTGGPSSGKTTVLEEIEKRGHQVLSETAREVIKKVKAETKEEHERREILMYLLQEAREAECKTRTFLDRSIIDIIAYSKHYLGIIPDGVETKRRYDCIFIFERLPLVNDSERRESLEEAEKLHNLLIEEYKRHGYEPIFVPVFESKSLEESVKRRADFVLSKITNLRV